MAKSRGSMRWRFLAAGAAAVAVAVLLGGGLDRAMVIAGFPAPMRFASTAAVMLACLVLPLMWTLERWVIRPIAALDRLHDAPPGTRRPVLPTAGLPLELAEVIHHHTELLHRLDDHNAALKEQVDRRTAALEVLIESADALSQMAGATDAEVLLAPLGHLAPGAAAVVVQRDDTGLEDDGLGWTAHVAPPGPVPEDLRETLEARVRKTFGRDVPGILHVAWHPPIDPEGPAVTHVHLLAREPVSQGSARSIGLLAVASSGLVGTADDVRRVLSVTATWLRRVRPDTESARRPMGLAADV